MEGYFCDRCGQAYRGHFTAGKLVLVKPGQYTDWPRNVIQICKVCEDDLATWLEAYLHDAKTK